MIKRLFFAVYILVLAGGAGLTAQEGDFAPYVSHIRAEPRNNLIRLTWVDSPDARGVVYIFRSTRPFGGSVPPNSRPVVVRYGEQYYIDDTDDIDNLFYFIAASDISGRRYDVIIPRTNSINVNLAQSADLESLMSAAEAEIEINTSDNSAGGSVVVPVPEPVRGITNLKARQEGEKVIITYETTDPRRKTVLYRSIQPVKRPQDLINAFVVQSGIGSPFVDIPVPGLTWYYAVIFEDEISSGNMGIRLGRNATDSPVLISGDKTNDNVMRPIPLPAMTLSSTTQEGPFITNIQNRRRIPLSSEAEKVLNNSQVPLKAPLQQKKPRVFTIDLQSPSGGEESALFQIIKDYFEKFDWEGSRAGLSHYLTLPRSKDVEARARFYLGQALYFTGSYKEALMEFMSIKTLHPVEASIWIDAVLSAMVY
jgi:hypothetical protein